MESDGPRGIAAGRGRQLTEAERKRLLAHFGELLRAKGMDGAAQELGVSARTLRRLRASGNLTPTLEEALSRHAADSLASGDAPWWCRTGELDERLVRLEQAVRELAERQAAANEAGQTRELEAGVNQRSVGQRLDHLEVVIDGLLSMVGALEAGRKTEVVPDRPDRVHTDEERRHIGGQGRAVTLSAEVQGLVDERDAARAEEEGATDELGRLAAAERRLEAELRLIRDHGETWPLGQQWSRSKRSEEVAWRLDALAAHRRGHRRLRRTRWLRRVLTLGLWWVSRLELPRSF